MTLWTAILALDPTAFAVGCIVGAGAAAICFALAKANAWSIE